MATQGDKPSCDIFSIGVPSLSRGIASEGIEATNAPHQVAETMLAHVVDSSTERAYHRAPYIEERRALLMNWADYLNGRVESVVLL